MSMFATGTEAIRRFRGILKRGATASPTPGCGLSLDQDRAIERYFAEGRKPWTKGYVYYKDRLLTEVVNDPATLERFRTGAELPDEYGVGIDERCIEYPWALSQLSDCGPRLLDAGSALNHEYLLEHDLLEDRSTLIYTLAPEPYSLSRHNVSYVYGDLRETLLRDNYFDVVACISTLEHVGMDNTMLYSSQELYQECDSDAHLAVLKEIRRVLKPGGILLITVPFGKAENHGWMQQFDLARVHRLIDEFGGRVEHERYYRYLATGWIRTGAEECAECEYFNVHARQNFDEDNAAAARAVACLRLKKDETEVP